MRTLNRPMFNMGGPIKEGIMHGIREPYKGGQLVRPGPGRPGYAGENKWGQYFQNIFKKSGPVVKQVFGKKFKPVVGAIDQIAKQKWLKSLHPSRIKETVGIPGSTTGSAWMTGPANILSKIKKVGPLYKKAWQKAPYTTLGAHLWPAPYAARS